MMKDLAFSNRWFYVNPVLHDVRENNVMNG